MIPSNRKPYKKRTAKKRPAKRLPADSWMDKLKGTLPRNKINRSKLKAVGIDEKSIQNHVESYLRLKGLKYFHIPDPIYQLCAPFSKTPIHLKRIISDTFKGVPDLIIWKTKTYEIGGDKLPTPEVGMDCLMIELKKKNAKARQSQTKWHGELPVHVIDNIEDAINLIQKWSEQ